MKLTLRRQSENVPGWRFSTTNFVFDEGEDGGEGRCHKDRRESAQKSQRRGSRCNLHLGDATLRGVDGKVPAEHREWPGGVFGVTLPRCYDGRTNRRPGKSRIVTTW